MADQASAVLVRLTKLSAEGADPCSPASLKIMRQVDLSSIYIQAVGAMSGTTMICASIEPGLHSDLGSVNATTPQGVEIRGDVHFDFSPSMSYIVVQKGPFAVIVNRDLLLDPTAGQKVLLGILTPPLQHVITVRGSIGSALTARALQNYPMTPAGPAAQSHTYRSGSYLVSVITSSQHYAGAVSAVPMSQVQARIVHYEMLFGPLGLAGGLALASVVLLLARRRAGFRTMLLRGFKRREFSLVYQPIVDLDTGAWCGAEALVRWHRPHGTAMPPDLFVPMIERYGMSRRLAEEVFRLAAPDLAELARHYPLAWLSLNLNGPDLVEPTLVDIVRRLLAEAGAPPEQLVLELTEHSFVDPDVARPVIDQLHELGVRVAIDDFGTGFSNLSHLARLNLDVLKIDKTFIAPLGTEAPTSQVASHVVQLAHALGLSVVAEGVEQPIQAERLRQEGVKFAQGWHYSEALPFDEFLQTYERTQQPVQEGRSRPGRRPAANDVSQSPNAP